jgi:hypothetical protein
MNMNIMFVEKVAGHAEQMGTRTHHGKRSLNGFLHDFAQINSPPVVPDLVAESPLELRLFRCLNDSILIQEIIRGDVNE